jgi:hypothetical protein
MKLLVFTPVRIEFKPDDYKHSVKYQTMMKDWLSQWTVANNYGIMVCDMNRAKPGDFPPFLWALEFIDVWRQVRLRETVPEGYSPLNDFSFTWMEKPIDLETKAVADLNRGLCNRGLCNICSGSIRSMLNYNQTVEIENESVHN